MNKPYATVYRALYGYKAVIYWFNPEGFWEPWDTGYLQYETPEEAELDAKAWAESEGIDFVPFVKDNTGSDDVLNSHQIGE